MKLLAVLSFTLLFGSASMAQQVDERLLSSYSQVELNEMISTNPERYQLLVSSIGNATAVMDFPKGKDAKIQQEISLPSGDYTYLDLKLKISESNQYYKITGSDKVLMVKSFFVLENERK